MTRVIRDFSADDIVVGNKVTNLREVAERALRREGGRLPRHPSSRDPGKLVRPEALELAEMAYETSIGDEVFLQYVTPDDRLVAFLRLSLPRAAPFARELASSAIIREVHVYGASLALSRRCDGQGAAPGARAEAGRARVRARRRGRLRRPGGDLRRREPAPTTAAWASATALSTSTAVCPPRGCPGQIPENFPPAAASFAHLEASGRRQGGG